DNNQDTPYPAETPSSSNPPDGAIIDYSLSSPLSADVAANMKLQIFDAQHNLVREYSSKPEPHDPAPKNVPDYWFKENAALTNHAAYHHLTTLKTELDLRKKLIPPSPATAPKPNSSSDTRQMGAPSVAQAGVANSFAVGVVTQQVGERERCNTPTGKVATEEEL